METKICDKCKQEKEVSQFLIKFKHFKLPQESKTCQSCSYELRTCDVCGRQKPLSSFQKERRNGSIYIRKTCGGCKTTIRNWKQKQKLMESIGQTCCQHCGISDIRVLMFHHKDPNMKEFGIAKKLSYSMKILLKEVEKCEVLCQNCHTIVHSPFAFRTIPLGTGNQAG